MNMKSYWLNLRLLVVCILFLIFLSIGTSRAHAQFRTDFSSCYTYDPTSGSTGQTTLTLAGGKTVSIMNSSPGSIFQTFNFNASPTQNLYNHCSLNIYGSPFNARVKLDFVTPQGGLLDFPKSSAWPVQGTSFWDYGSPSTISSVKIPPIVDTLPNFNIYSNYLNKITYTGLTNLSVPIPNEDAIIDSISQTGKINFRVSDYFMVPGSGAPEFANVSAPATNCVKLSGSGPIKVVFMREASYVSNLGKPLSAGFFLNEVDTVIKNGFNSIYPFNDSVYNTRFSYYVDLKRYNIPRPSITFFDHDPHQHIQSSCSVSEKDKQVLFYNEPGVNMGGYTIQLGKVIFINAAVGTNKLAHTVIHELAHAIGALNDEYILASVGNNPSIFSDTSIYRTTCALAPQSSYKGPDNKIYGSTSARGCLYMKTTEFNNSANYYRPSVNSIMNLIYLEEEVLDSRFNVIGCGYLIAGISGEETTKENAQKYWPKCLDAARLGKVIKDGIPPVAPVPNANSVRTTPKTSLNSSSSFFARLFDSIEYSLLAQVGSANNISLTAGDTITVSGSGFTATNNSAQLVNTADSTKIYDIDSVPSTDTLVMSFDVPTTTPAGTYSLKVGAFNSPWTSTVATLIVRACTAGCSSPSLVPIVDLIATPSSITIGQSSTLTWSSPSATSCAATGAWTGTKATSGTLSITPIVTSTYSLTCTGAGGTSPSASAMVTVTAALPTTMPATPTYSCPAQVPPASAYVLSGSSCIMAAYTIPTYTQSATLSYYCAYGGNPWYGYYSGTYGYFCYGSGPGIAAIYSASSHYTCPAGSTGPSAGNLCTFSAVNVPASMISATVSSYSCLSGYTLSGSTCNTTVLSPNAVTVLPWSCPSSVVVGQSLSYTLNWNGGPMDKSWSTFEHFIKTDDPNVSFGDGFFPSPATTQWFGNVATNRTFTIPVGTPPGTYKVMVGLYSGSTRANTLVAGSGVTVDTQNRFQVGTVMVTTVSPPAVPTVTLTATPTSITSGQSSTLSWSSTDATSCTGVGFLTGGAKSNSVGVSVTPTSNTTYNLTCIGSGGTSQPSSVTITVSTPSSPNAVTVLPWSGPSSVVVGQSLSYTLNWNGGPMDKSWSTFEHFIKTDDPNVSFGDGFFPSPLTTQWTGNVQTTRTFTVPANTPPGTYKVMVGLYSGSTRASTLVAGSGVTADTQSRFQVGTVIVNAPPSPNTVTVLPWTGSWATSVPSVVAGQPLTYTLNWSGGPMTASWSTFEHFVKSDDSSVSFGDGFYPSPATTNWSGGVTTSHTFTVPANTPPGTYKVMVGLYSGSTRASTLIAGSGVTPDTQNRFQVGTVTVTAASTSFLNKFVASVIEAFTGLFGK